MACEIQSYREYRGPWISWIKKNAWLICWTYFVGRNFCENRTLIISQLNTQTYILLLHGLPISRFWASSGLLPGVRKEGLTTIWPNCPEVLHQKGAQRMRIKAPNQLSLSKLNYPFKSENQRHCRIIILHLWLWADSQISAIHCKL